MAQVAIVIELMEQGTSETAACKEVGINRGTFRSAALRFESADAYARGLHVLAQEQTEKLEVAITDMRKGTIDSQQARVEIDARKWFASKFLPKRYGDKIQQEISGGLTTTGDPQAIADQLVTQAVANPTMNPVIRKWAQDLIDRLPRIEE
jgi:hypothetical protein